MSVKKGKAPPVLAAADCAPPCTAADIPTQRSIDTYLGSPSQVLRKISGMKLSEVSAAIGTSEDCIARYERGEQRLSPTDLIALAELFGVSLHELFPEDPGQITSQLH